MVEIISRAAWGARPPKYRRAIPTPSPELWAHHSVSASGGPSRIRGIQNFHMDERGWPDIAYTFLINHEGLIFEGVPSGFRGTHTANHNVSGHAVCLLGNFNTTQPSQAALGALVELVQHGHGQGWWPLGFTGGHRDTRGANPGDCPGDLLYARLPQINALVQEDDMPLSDEDVQRIADAVMKYPLPDNTSGTVSNTQALIRATRDHAAAAAGQTSKSKIAEAVAAAGVSGASADAIVDEIAKRLGDG